MHKLYSNVCARGKLLGFKCLHLWAQAPASPKRKSAQQFSVERLHLLCARAHSKTLHVSVPPDCARAHPYTCTKIHAPTKTRASRMHAPPLCACPSLARASQARVSPPARREDARAAATWSRELVIPYSRNRPFFQPRSPHD